MLRIKCPWCGVRNEDEFSYGGDATVQRPADDASQDEQHGRAGDGERAVHVAGNRGIGVAEVEA